MMADMDRQKLAQIKKEWENLKDMEGDHVALTVALWASLHVDALIALVEGAATLEKHGGKQ